MTDKNMKMHIGTKLVLAIAMNRLAYNSYQGWDLPDNEDGADEGYLIEYQNGGKPNHPDHENYISWSPKDVFENAYEDPRDRMSFSSALEFLKGGNKVARSGWNGKSMFIFLVPGSQFKVNRAPLLGIYPEGTDINYHAHIDMKTADNMIVPWLASQTDMLADDWVLVD